MILQPKGKLNMNKRILITGGSHAEIPLIESAHLLNQFVITTGNNRNGLGHKLADKYIPGDFSDKNFVLELAKKENVDAIISGCNDFAYISTAFACEKLGFKGHDSYKTSLIIHHKDSFRLLLSDLNIKTPRILKCRCNADISKACNMIGFPIVIKPADLTGGKGVQICNNEDEALSAYKQASEATREKYIIAEEYISGTNHGTSVLLKNKKIVAYIIDNEKYYENKYLVSGAYYPSTVAECTRNQLFSDIEKIAHALDLCDGLFHAQFIVMQDLQPVIIDPCRRAPGDLYILFAKYATSIDFPMLILKSEEGIEIPSHYNIECHNVARMCIMTDHNGIYKDLQISRNISTHIKDKLIWGFPGEKIENYKTYKSGIIFLECDNFAGIHECAENFHNNVQILTF